MSSTARVRISNPFVAPSLALWRSWCAVQPSTPSSLFLTPSCSAISNSKASSASGTCLWHSKTSRIFFHSPSRFLTCLRRSCSGLGGGATCLLRALLKRLRSPSHGKNLGPERPPLGRESRPPKLEWVGNPLLVLLDNGSALENLFQPASPGTE